MLTANFNLLRKSEITKKYDRNLLSYLFIIFYIDMYDLALFAGYSVYLARVVLPVYDIYKCLLIFSVVFLLTQFAKFFGFMFYFLSHKSDGFLKYSIFLLLLSYFVLIIFPTYQQFGMLSFFIFIVFRILFGLALGCEMGAAIKLTNNLSTNDASPEIFYVIWLAGEVGIFVSMFINRVTVLRYFEAISYEHSWRIQFAINFCLLLYCGYNKFKNNIYSVKNKFSRNSFILLLISDWRYILVRTVTHFYSVLLILAIVIRAPRNMELIFGLSPRQVNHELIIMSIIGFIGANSVSLIRRYVSAYHCMVSLLVLCTLMHIYVWAFRIYITLDAYELYIFGMTFFYGAFLRVTPEVLNRSICFSLRTHIIGRFVSYMISYAILIAIAELLFDYSHYEERYLRDSLSMVIMVFFGILGLVSLIIFKKRYA